MPPHTHPRTQVRAAKPGGPLNYLVTFSVWQARQQVKSLELLLDTQGVIVTRDRSRPDVEFHESQMRIGIHDGAVSSLHALFYVDTSTMRPAPVMLDLQTSNGTRIETSGAPVEVVSSVKLEAGMRIRFGGDDGIFHLRVDSLGTQTTSRPRTPADALADIPQELSQDRIDAMLRLRTVMASQVLICGGASVGKTYCATRLAKRWGRKAEGVDCRDNPHLIPDRTKPAPVVVENIECLSDEGQEELCKLIDRADALILTTSLELDRLRVWSRRKDLAPGLSHMLVISIPSLLHECDKRYFAREIQREYLAERAGDKGRDVRGDKPRAPLSPGALDFVASVEWPQGILQMRDVITFSMLKAKQNHSQDLVEDVDIVQAYVRQDLHVSRRHYDTLTLKQFEQLAKKTFMVWAGVRERGNLTWIASESLGSGKSDQAHKRSRGQLDSVQLWDKQKGIQLPGEDDLDGEE